MIALNLKENFKAEKTTNKTKRAWDEKSILRKKLTYSHAFFSKFPEDCCEKPRQS